MDPGAVDVHDFIYFFAGCILLSALLLLVAIVGLRRVILHHGSVVTKRSLRRWWSWRFRIPWLPGPSLDGNPVLWLEWHRQKPSRWVRAVWSLYALAALGFSLYAFLHAVLNIPAIQREELGLFVNAFQVAIGLLLVSVTSVTSLQDERVRGSLDVLLSSPLSTIGIYWGKWWGSYRIIFLLTLLPTFVASAAYVRQSLELGRLAPLTSGQARYFLLMPVVTCCYGAAVVSTGLVLAIWIKGPGRAMATSVVVYIFMTVGILFGAVMVRQNSPYVALGSSFLASALLTQECWDPPFSMREVIPSLMIWCIVYSVGAAVLSMAACHTFDRCLGRMPDRMSRRIGMERAVRRALGRESVKISIGVK
jgi:ABC-type transport system involved in multi-copper enzyme maturation permease subunit